MGKEVTRRSNTLGQMAGRVVIWLAAHTQGTNGRGFTTRSNTLMHKTGLQYPQSQVALHDAGPVTLHSISGRCNHIHSCIHADAHGHVSRLCCWQTGWTHTYTHTCTKGTCTFTQKRKHVYLYREHVHSNAKGMVAFTHTHTFTGQHHLYHDTATDSSRGHGASHRAPGC